MKFDLTTSLLCIAALAAAYQLGKRRAAPAAAGAAGTAAAESGDAQGWIYPGMWN